ncbi:glycosyltransferase family 1 protein [Bipolaris oryzae ATCC 44560]|uniref:Glycosyltransferase family 1 protein n=1 Tax=Bipolaris oryzae ATCC 44560 TaxID=930090 RepID=W6ZMD4_COCMI|nr:glycosyltransferase family 1 protein [Bipolaris oryzae ATCC 44560]EUC51250.1 glycosyltransferase family 1 protein [Bipolaris oryzae ATCC 44560]
MSTPSATEKPALLICASPYTGHVTPLRTIAAGLVQSGYHVYFLTGAAFSNAVAATGAKFLPLPADADLDEAELGVRWPGIKSMPHDIQGQVGWNFEHIMIGAHMEAQFQGIQIAVSHVRAAEPSRRLIALTDVWFLGSLVAMSGAPGPQPDGWIGLGMVAMGLSSKDCAPWGPGELPDPSEAGRVRDSAILAHMREAFAGAQARYEDIMSRCGAQRIADWFWDEPWLLPNLFVQLSLPSLEWHRTDAPSTIRFSGGLPKPAVKKGGVRPPWLDELISRRQAGKYIVAVSQGTIAVNFNDLVVPTMEALGDRSDVSLVVALGRAGRSLPAEVYIPSNARVEGFIPFDELLPYTDVFVTNGGYGSVQHAIAQGVPLVLAGASEDKPEASARAEWAGVAVNLRTATPTRDQVKDAVNRILVDKTYANKAKQLKEEMEHADPLTVIIESIEDVAKRPSLG